MNKNIKQLWDTALEEFSKEHQFATIMLPEPLREKFAELIVRECADLCNKFGDRLEDERPNKDLDSVAYECADGLKRHFGVKE